MLDTSYTLQTDSAIDIRVASAAHDAPPATPPTIRTRRASRGGWAGSGVPAEKCDSVDTVEVTAHYRIHPQTRPPLLRADSGYDGMRAIRAHPCRDRTQVEDRQCRGAGRAANASSVDSPRAEARRCTRARSRGTQLIRDRSIGRPLNRSKLHLASRCPREVSGRWPRNWSRRPNSRKYTAEHLADLYCFEH